MQLQLKPLILPLNYEPFKRDYTNLANNYILNALKDIDCRIFVFGSRARGTFQRFSDLDIGIIPGKESVSSIYEIKDYLNYESEIPFKIDIVDFSTVSEKFKQQAMQNVIWWKE